MSTGAGESLHTEERHAGRSNATKCLAVLLVVLVGSHDIVEQAERDHRLLVHGLPCSSKAMDWGRVESGDDVDQSRVVVQSEAALRGIALVTNRRC